MVLQLPDFNPRHVYLQVEPRVTIMNTDRLVDVIWPVDGKFKLRELVALFEGFQEVMQHAEKEGGAFAVSLGGLK